MRAEFVAEIATPASIGWYDPFLVDKNFYLRPTSIKGVWRWWARAFAAGALHEAGCTGRDFLSRVHRIVAGELGLGSTESASRYDLTVEVLEEPQIERNGTDLQRFRLLSRGKKGEDKRPVEYAVGGKFRIAVEGDGPNFTTAISILTVALTLSGIGKGGRKALGSLDIVDASGHAPSRRSLKELIDDARRRIPVERCGAPTGLPPISAVARNAFEVYSVRVDYKSLHNVFLRQERARMARRHYKAPDPLDHDAWLLGLPRTQRGTGYLADVGRRASAVLASWHGPRHIYGGGGYISIFLSSDWPPQITWKGGKGRSTTIRIDRGALDRARSTFIRFVQGLGWNPQRIWP